MDIVTKTRFEESISKPRQLSQHRVKILCRPLDINIVPQDLAATEGSVTAYLTGRKIVKPHEIDDPKGLSAVGLQFVILDFDKGMMYGVYYYEREG